MEKEEQYECEKCDHIFLKEQKRNLHMSRTHNMKTIKSTPYPARRKVGRPQIRFICDKCNLKLISESELGNHMSMVHNNNLKRSRSKKKQETVQRVMPDTKSPPKKKNNVDITIQGITK